MKIKNILPVIMLIFFLLSCSGGTRDESNFGDVSDDKYSGDNSSDSSGDGSKPGDSSGDGSKPGDGSSDISTGSSKLNDTGITWGGNYPSGNNTDCTGVQITRQDCSHGRDALAAAGKMTKTGSGAAGFDFTKLGKDGTALTVQNANWSDTGSEAAGTRWSCVKDNHTGLVWEVKTNDGSVPTGTNPTVSQNNIHHKDNTYRWGGLTALGRNHPDKKGTYHVDWNKLVTATNSEKLCGFGDWRVPTFKELGSIVHAGRTKPAIDTHYFPNTPGEWYWSSSPLAANSNNAWRLYFDYGYDNLISRDDSYRVRLVRFGQ